MYFSIIKTQVFLSFLIFLVITSMKEENLKQNITFLPLIRTPSNTFFCSTYSKKGKKKQNMEISISSVLAFPNYMRIVLKKHLQFSVITPFRFQHLQLHLALNSLSLNHQPLDE